MTRMIASVSIPAAPTPVTARPTRNIGSSIARDVINDPKEKITVATKIQFLGANICERRPANGDMLDIAI